MWNPPDPFDYVDNLTDEPSLPVDAADPLPF